MQNYFDNEATSSALHATMKPARSGKCLVTLSTYEDRKEALFNTEIMEDAVTYRSKGPRQSRQQNDEVDNTETKHDAPSHIPKPPPLQMAYKHNNNNNNNSNTQAISTNDRQTSGQRLTFNSHHSVANDYNGGSDTYSRPNKTPATVNGINANRQTLRLGTVTIGEYRQQTLRREPEKFDFISTQQKKGRDSGDTTPTNEALQSELQNTLSRANLRKSNGNSFIEHQRNCPLQQQQQQQLQQQRQSVDYGNNVDEMSRKLQKSSLNENNTTELLTKTNNRSANGATGTTGVGILKNGNRTGTSSSSKSTEKSIKFG